MIRNAFHFLDADWHTSSGRLLVEVGKPLIHTGDLIPCSSGLHASMRAFDALSYARGPVVTLVQCEGDILDHDDKFLCRSRLPLWGYDCTDELWTFARLCAIEVLPFWPDAPDVVREFLETGNEDLRAAAGDAARDAAGAAHLDRCSHMLESLLIDGAVSRGLLANHGAAERAAHFREAQP